MSGPTHHAYRTGNNINVQVYGRKRQRYAQEIANEMVASYERAELARAEHPFYDFTVTELPSEDIKAENERLNAQAARDAKALADVQRIIDHLEAHPNLEGETVEARDANGLWFDVADALRTAIAPATRK